MTNGRTMGFGWGTLFGACAMGAVMDHPAWAIGCVIAAGLCWLFKSNDWD